MPESLTARRQRILDKIESFGSQKAFAEAIGMNQSRVSKALNAQWLSDRRLAPIEQAIFQMETQHLNGNNDAQQHKLLALSSSSANLPSDLIRIPDVEVEVGAGPETEITFEVVQNGIYMSREQARQEFGVDPARLHRITVRGNSMEPTLKAGDRIYVARWDGEELMDGWIYVLRGPLGLMIKRLRFEERSIWISSDNTDAPNWKMSLEEFQQEYRIIAFAVRRDGRSL